jgi:hypothetical protein
MAVQGFPFGSIAVQGSPEVFSPIKSSFHEWEKNGEITRLTNAFSKKLNNFKAAVALHFAYYNFVKVHSSLRVTPAMALGVSSRLWTVSDLVKIAY